MNNAKIKVYLYLIIGISAAIFGLLIPIYKPEGLLEYLKLIPKIVTIDLLLYFGFVKWFWKWKIFKHWLVPFENLNGTWKGYIKTNWVNPETGEKPAPIPAILSIQQSFHKVSCVMRTGEMISHSYIADFIIDNENQVNQLCYSYQSNPNPSVRDRSEIHNGTMLFNILITSQKLEGQYWTERKTTGEIDLDFHSKKRLQELPSELGKHPVSNPTQGTTKRSN